MQGKCLTSASPVLPFLFVAASKQLQWCFFVAVLTGRGLMLFFHLILGLLSSAQGHLGGLASESSRMVNNHKHHGTQDHQCSQVVLEVPEVPETVTTRRCLQDIHT